MPLAGFQDAIEEISGVTSTTRSAGELRVKFFANPSNYSKTISELKTTHNVAQVDRDTSSGHIVLVFEVIE